MIENKSTSLDDEAFTIATIACLCEKIMTLGGDVAVRLTQADYDSVAYKTLMQGHDVDTGDLLFKFTKRELS